MNDGHLVPLPGTDWTLWRDGVLRTTGFPAEGLDWLTAPGCGEAADALLDGHTRPEAFEAAYAAADAECSKTVRRIAADPLFREAITWQNPSFAALLGKVIAGDGPPSRRNRRENGVARYWQRYCAKNDTIGFFGPVTWVTVDPGTPVTQAVPGPALTRSRRVFFEYWALELFAAKLAGDPEIRRWLPVGVYPHLTVDPGLRQVLRPDGPPIPLSPLDCEVLARCDGKPAAEVTRAVATEAEAAPDEETAQAVQAVRAEAASDEETAQAVQAVRAVRAEAASDEDAARALADLADRGVLRWGFDLPYSPDAEQVLRAGIAGLPASAARDRAAAAFGRLCAARDAVAAAAGDPDRVASALAGLDAVFAAVTGAEPQRRPGESYAGRRVCYEDTIRDLDVTIGSRVLEALSGPMSVLLPAARWLASAMAMAYEAALRDIYVEVIEPGEHSVPLSRLWAPVMGLLNSAAAPARAVTTEFRRRWEDLFGLAELPAGTSRLSLRSDDLAARAAGMFAAPGPAWPGARIHSPDLQICAASAQALAAGEFTVVLGEIHVAWPTLDSAVFTTAHPDPGSLLAAYAADIGPQFRPLYPTDWPRYSGRMAPDLGADDYQLAFAAAPGGKPGRLVPVTAITVTDTAGELTAQARDGRCWPLRQLFTLLLAWVVTEAFKFTRGGAHSPRITVDNMVLTREMWRSTVGQSRFAVTVGADTYLAARRWRRVLGLPEKVFAHVATEIKPVYVDFTSPRYVAAFSTMLRTAQASAGEDAPVVFSELLPGPSEAWVPDREGRRYFSELRLQFRDPLPPVA